MSPSRTTKIALGAAAAAACALLLAGCSSPGSSDPFAGFGPDPTIPPPHKGLLPQIGVPEVVGWSGTAKPVAPDGFTVTRFADGLDHPRWLLALPNGDVLVAEAAAPPKAIKEGGFRAWAAKLLMSRVGATTPSADRITLLRDADGDGVAETKATFAQGAAHGLKSPFGMTLVGETLYVANADGVVSFPYRPGQTSVTGAGTPVFSLPGGPRNHHWTKNVMASPDGAKLYATVGSDSNIGENGLETETGRAAVWEYDLATKQARVFASGLRNPNGLDFEPATGALWTVVNERDEIGPDLPPDYLTSVKDGGFYGWPYSYWGTIVDKRVTPERPDRVATALKPDYGLGAHTASLGLVFYRGEAFPAAYRGGAFIGQHGSWNRKPLAGYRVVFVPFAGGRPQTPAQEFLTGFLDADGKIQGRPVGVAVDGRGGLLVADDVGDVIWRVAATGG
ncbi:sorbosone dehydrogenase family protein [Phenylobacterium sp.]|uniref:PQQ-dependent sugar dehydrogenase n=1 Tax=Phenylobacterium sp. TaxID=1871053 RepID=UPI00301C15D1